MVSDEKKKQGQGHLADMHNQGWMWTYMYETDIITKSQIHWHSHYQ